MRIAVDAMGGDFAPRAAVQGAFLAAAEECDTVVCVHIGSSSKMVITAPDAPMDVLITLSPINIVQAATDFVWSKVPQKFPRLKYALSEGGIGWIPYFRERIDYTYDRHRFWTGFPSTKPHR